MKKACVLLLGFLLLSGCSILRRSPNTAGRISDSGTLGSTMVEGVGNADEAATLDRKEHSIIIDHHDGDELIVSAESGPKILEGILAAIARDEHASKPNDDSTKNPFPVKKKVEVTTLPNEWTISYKPATGAKTSISGIEVKASTGHSREDTAAVTAEILSSTRVIMYVGIALVLGGGAIAWFMRVPMQGAMVSGVGVGLIILQATLANPMWSWIMMILLLGIPLFWLWHLWKNKKVGDAMVKSIEEFKNKNPDKKEDLEVTLSRNMTPLDKKMVKHKKKAVIKE